MLEKPGSTVACAASVTAWIKEVRELDAMEVRDGSLRASRCWSLTDEHIRHTSGRYFSIVGVAWGDTAGEAAAFIRQEEVGTLGLIARPAKGGLEFLVGAKAEPGNVGFVQLSPTCQATMSNLDQVHGGAAPPFAGLFTDAALTNASVLSDSLQSEHGWRFYRKRNRNVAILAPEASETATHRWLPAALVLSLLGEDNCVNVDARSVLVAMNWGSLYTGGPFRSHDAFSRALARSYAAPPRKAARLTLSLGLARARAAAQTSRILPVTNLAGWVFDPGGPRTLTNGRRHVRHIAVRSSTREVESWDQPILCEDGITVHDLICAEGPVGLEFAFLPQWQPGLIAGAELMPTRTRQAPGLDTISSPKAGETLIKQTAQAEEGGRFDRDVAVYRLLQTERPAVKEPALVWLTLSEVQDLVASGVFSNETRTALSIVLSYG